MNLGSLPQRASGRAPPGHQHDHYHSSFHSRGPAVGCSEALGKALLRYPANCEPQWLPVQNCFCRQASAGPPCPGRWVQHPTHPGLWRVLAWLQGQQTRAGPAVGPEGAKWTLAEHPGKSRRGPLVCSECLRNGLVGVGHECGTAESFLEAVWSPCWAWSCTGHLAYSRCG